MDEINQPHTLIYTQGNNIYSCIGACIWPSLLSHSRVFNIGLWKACKDHNLSLMLSRASEVASLLWGGCMQIFWSSHNTKWSI